MEHPCGPCGTARQELRAAAHRDVQRHRFVDDGAERVEKGTHSGIFGDGTGERQHGFVVFPRQRGHARRAFAFQRLAVDAPFAGHHQVAGGDAFLEGVGTARRGRAVEPATVQDFCAANGPACAIPRGVRRMDCKTNAQ